MTTVNNELHAVEIECEALKKKKKHLEGMMDRGSEYMKEVEQKREAEKRHELEVTTSTYRINFNR